MTAYESSATSREVNPFAFFAGTIHIMRTPEETPGVHTLGESYEPTIESDFEQGKKYYELYRARSGRKVEAGERKNLLKLAMLSCEQALTHTGTHKERLIKIEVLFLMMEIVTHTKPIDTWKRERYFYEAVGITRDSSKKEDFLMTPHGQRIKESYCTSIDPQFGKNFNNKECCDFLDLMRFKITAESNKKIAQRIGRATDTKNYITTRDTPEKILDKLEIALGPVRLVIIAGENGEICAHHRIERSEAECLQEDSHGMRTIRVEVFHKEKRYQIIIDRGSRESTSMFSDTQIKKIIEPILKIYIERLESGFFSAHADHSACIRHHEESEKIEKPRDYSAFIERALSAATLRDGGEGMDSVEDYARAIDIARLMMGSSRSRAKPMTDDLYIEIDSILGGRMNRGVCDMVSSILLARDETMHGTGYPSGLNQRMISLETKLYAIISAYETLCSMYPGNPAQVLSALEGWSGGGYLDRGLLSLFISTLGEAREIPVREKRIPTDRRINRYKSYRGQWTGLITHIDDMEHLYDEFRGTGVSEDRQKTLSQLIDKKRLELYAIAKLLNIVIIERHEETLSDTQDNGAPGDPYEQLTPTGIVNAIQKGKVLKQLSPEIYASPLPRARETAERICQNVHDCIGNCLRCPHIQMIETLRNPAKNREDGQNLDLLAKFINFENQKDLRQLVLDIISSSNQSMHLIITHGDIIRHLLLIIVNLFAKDKFIGLRDEVGHETVHTLLLQGGQIISWNLMFSISDWAVMLDKINSYTERIFGDIFYWRGNKQMNLIKLRNKFLDYIDEKSETNPDKVGEFIRALDNNPLTAHFSEILRIEGLIIE